MIPVPLIGRDRLGRRDVILPQGVNRAAIERIDGMACDHAPLLLELGACKRGPTVSPRLVVPSLSQAAPGHDHLHVDLPMVHFCDLHLGEIAIDALLAMPGVKAMAERHAKRQRPIDFRCDFDAAHVVYVSIFSPEYKYFQVALATLGRTGAEEQWGAPIYGG